MRDTDVCSAIGCADVGLRRGLRRDNFSGFSACGSHVIEPWLAGEREERLQDTRVAAIFSQHDSRASSPQRQLRYPLWLFAQLRRRTASTQGGR
jgi:hypothetical protein